MPRNCRECGSVLLEEQQVCLNCGAHFELQRDFKPFTIFYSYSHKDEELRAKMETHLATLQRSGLIRQWHDRKIIAGQKWTEEINRYLEEAQLILFLISADFINSVYISDVEVKRALERRDAGQAVVVPVILRPVMWQIIPEFRSLQALPEGARPVTEWPSLDSAFLNICQGIVTLLYSVRLEVHTESRTARSAGDFSRPRRAALRRRARVLDAALPKRVPLKSPSALLVMIRRTDSLGLRAVVEADPEFDIGKDEINSQQFKVAFPTDETGAPHYLWRGCMPNAEAAFYFSGVTYTTLGYGDVVLAEPWRLLAPVEGLMGVLMCGLSTG